MESGDFRFRCTVVPDDARIPGDPPHGTACPFHLVDFFHLSHLQLSLSDTSTKTS